jgi:hypothetical protein
MWLMWWKVALQHAHRAEEARRDILAGMAPEDSEARTEALTREVEASLQTVCCAVFACEALVIVWTPLVMESVTVQKWHAKGDRTPIGSRRNQVFRRVHGAVLGEELDRAWAPVFELRHNVVHHLEVMAEPGPHPSGIGNVSAIAQQFTAEVARAAVDLLERVTTEAATTKKDAVSKWLRDHRHALDTLEAGRLPR